jgi:hypothetical protein
VISSTVTSEGIHRFFAVQMYSRYLFVARLLPLLRAGAPDLARVVSVASGSLEGPINTEDWQGLKTSMLETRAQGASLSTLAFQRLAKEAPEVSLINQHPGWVKTGATGSLPGVVGVVMRTMENWFEGWVTTPIEESGARHVFVATSSAYKSRAESGNGVPLVKGLSVHKGADDEVGSGVYSLNKDGEGPGEKAVELLRRYNEDGTADKAWAYFASEVERVTGHPVL